MADSIDISQDNQAHDIEIALSNRSVTYLKFIGQCYFCAEPLAKVNFCDEFCRDDYDKLIEINKSKKV